MSHCDASLLPVGVRALVWLEVVGVCPGSHSSETGGLPCLDFFFFFKEFSSSVSPLELWVLTGVAHLRANWHIQVGVAKKSIIG